MNLPSSPQERRGATTPPSGVNSLVFFGGIILGVAVVAMGALALWGPENDVEKRREGGTTPNYASAAAAADSAALAASAEAAITVLPEAPPEPPPVEAPAPKKGSKKRGGRPKR